MLCVIAYVSSGLKQRRTVSSCKEFDSTCIVRTILSDSSPVGLENWQLTECYVFTDAVALKRKVQIHGLAPSVDLICVHLNSSV